MKKVLFVVMAWLLAATCAAHGDASDFVGRYVAKEGGRDAVVLTVVKQGGKLMAREDEPGGSPFEVQLASKQEIEKLLRQVDQPISSEKIVGIKTRDGDDDKIILVKVPVGTVFAGQQSKTGYFVLGMGSVEVQRR